MLSFLVFFQKTTLVDYSLLETLMYLIMKVVNNFVDLMKEVYKRTPSKAEIKHLVMTNQIHKSVAILKQLKAEDEKLVEEGIHCHLY
jgi:hypothetical protein